VTPLDPPGPIPVIGVVGPCNSGKSALTSFLTARGYPVHHIAQEHSYVPNMWQVVGHAEVLIFLDVSFPVAQARRRLDWQPADLEEQHRRLAHAQAHADLYLQTDSLSLQTVQEKALGFLAQRGFRPGP